MAVLIHKPIIPILQERGPITQQALCTNLYLICIPARLKPGARYLVGPQTIAATVAAPQAATVVMVVVIQTTLTGGGKYYLNDYIGFTYLWCDPHNVLYSGSQRGNRSLNYSADAMSVVSLGGRTNQSQQSQPAPREGCGELRRGGSSGSSSGARTHRSQPEGRSRANTISVSMQLLFTFFKFCKCYIVNL